MNDTCIGKGQGPVFRTSNKSDICFTEEKAVIKKISVKCKLKKPHLYNSFNFFHCNIRFASITVLDFLIKKNYAAICKCTGFWTL